MVGRTGTAVHFGVGSSITTPALTSSEPTGDWSIDDRQALIFKTALRGETVLTVEAFSLDVPSMFTSFFSGLGKNLIGKWVVGSGPYAEVASSYITGVAALAVWTLDADSIS